MQKKKKVCISFVFECLRSMRVEFIQQKSNITNYRTIIYPLIIPRCGFSYGFEKQLYQDCTNLKDTKRHVRRKNVGATRRHTWIPLYCDATGIAASSIYSSFSFRQERCVAMRNQCKTAKRGCTGHKSQPGVRY